MLTLLASGTCPGCERGPPFRGVPRGGALTTAIDTLSLSPISQSAWLLPRLLSTLASGPQLEAVGSISLIRLRALDATASLDTCYLGAWILHLCIWEKTQCDNGFTILLDKRERALLAGNPCPPCRLSWDCNPTVISPRGLHVVTTRNCEYFPEGHHHQF